MVLFKIIGTHLVAGGTSIAGGGRLSHFSYKFLALKTFFCAIHEFLSIKKFFCFQTFLTSFFWACWPIAEIYLPPSLDTAPH
jgi:hypothetical protein